MINQVDLQYFVELARVQHVSRAATRLGISQPTLSYSLKRIENEMGCELFVRTKKGVTLTSAGHKLLEQADALIHQWNEVLQSVKREVDDVSGLIKLGCHTAVAQYTLPAFLPDFLKTYPMINVTLHHDLSRHINESIMNDKLDIGIVVNPSPQPDLIIKEILKDRVLVWKSKQNQNPDVLIHDPKLIQTQDILKKLSKKGIHFKRLVESSSLEVIAKLVVAGAGCGILPERVIQAFNQDQVMPLKDSPQFFDRICLVYKPEFRRLKRAQVLIRHVLL